MLALSYFFKLLYLRFKGYFLKFFLKTKNKMRQPFCIGEYCYIMLPPLFKTRLSFLCFSLKHEAFVIFLVLKLRCCLIYIFISLMSLVSCSSFNIFLYTSKFLLFPLLFVLVLHFYIIQLYLNFLGDFLTFLFFPYELRIIFP